MFAKAFAPLLTWAITSSFADGELFKDMDQDLVDTAGGLLWKVRRGMCRLECSHNAYGRPTQTPSPSYDRLAAQRTWPLYVELGKLSRLYGKLIESARSEHDLSVVLFEMQLLERLSAKVREGWKAVRWSEVYDPAGLGDYLLHVFCIFRVLLTSDKQRHLHALRISHRGARSRRSCSRSRWSTHR
jgi:hypothetical protein